jgi:hypothetical protein
MSSMNGRRKHTSMHLKHGFDHMDMTIAWQGSSEPCVSHSVVRAITPPAVRT